MTDDDAVQRQREPDGSWAPRLAPLGEWSSFDGGPPADARPAPDRPPAPAAGPDPGAAALPRRPVGGGPAGRDPGAAALPRRRPVGGGPAGSDPGAAALPRRRPVGGGPAGADPGAAALPRRPAGGGPSGPDSAAGLEPPPLAPRWPPDVPADPYATAAGASPTTGFPPRLPDTHSGRGVGAGGAAPGPTPAPRLPGRGFAPPLREAGPPGNGGTDAMDLGGIAAGRPGVGPPGGHAGARFDAPDGDRLRPPGDARAPGLHDEATEGLYGGPRATATEAHRGRWGSDRDDARDPAAVGFRNRPGIGLVLGLVGLVALALSFTVLPWVVTAGDDVTFADIRAAAAVADDVTTVSVPPDAATTTTVPVGPVDPGAAPGATAPAGTASATGPAGPATTVPGTAPGAGTTTTSAAGDTATTATFGGMGLFGSPRQAPGDPSATSVPAGGTGIPATTAPAVTTGSTAPTVVPGTPVPTTLPSAVPAPSGPMGSLGGDYIDAFAEWGWIAVLVLTGIAVLFSTLIVPRSFAGRLVTGFLTAAVVGLLVNAADREGTSAPRVTGALVTILAGAGFAGAVWQLFGEDTAPSPAWGVWVGVGGATAAMLGCLLGTRRQPVEA
ncbi:MAG TPA: hypothetical protein VK306_08390 [Acidimicrobiales bacterium]|nr:hypothetical protein [Acidimicrobiales bacterium]